MKSVFLKLKDSKALINDYYNSIGELAELKEERLRKFQLYLLSMYQDIADACEKLGIQCFVVGGTCLGAIRHGGFIPWDDDLDISMTRDEYNVFREHFKELLGDKYILNAPNYSQKPIARFPKVLAKNTKLVQVGEEETEQSKVYIDIFILDSIPGNSLNRNVKGFFVNTMEFISGQVCLYNNTDISMHSAFKKSGKAQYYIREAIGFVFSYRSYGEWCNKIDKVIQYRGDYKKLVGLPTGRKHYLGEVFEESAFYPLKEMTFEGIKVKVPGNTDAYLKNLYHDYMQLPPPEKREHHFFTKLEF